MQNDARTTTTYALYLGFFRLVSRQPIDARALSAGGQSAWRTVGLEIDGPGFKRDADIIRYYLKIFERMVESMTQGRYRPRLSDRAERIAKEDGPIVISLDEATPTQRPCAPAFPHPLRPLAGGPPAFARLPVPGSISDDYASQPMPAMSTAAAPPMGTMHPCVPPVAHDAPMDTANALLSKARTGRIPADGGDHHDSQTSTTSER